MSHYALIDENNIVYHVSNFGNEVSHEDIINMFESQGVTAIKTSYNTHMNRYVGLDKNKKPLRKNFAGIGCKYDEELDAFILPKPYESWILNTDTGHWEPPIERPDDQKNWHWNEEEQNWEEF